MNRGDHRAGAGERALSRTPVSRLHGAAPVKAARWAARRVFAAPVGLRLRRSARTTRSVDDLVDLAYSFESALTGIEIVPLQKRSEIASLLRLLGDDPPENVLEIGTASGGTLFLFANVARPDARLISVDLPGGRFGGGYAWWRAGLYRSFVRSTQSLHLIRGDSHEQRILDRVQALLGGAKLDFLFIDGDHSYEGVERDFDMYRPLVRTGGIVAFHDIVPETPGSASSGPLRQAGGVPEFWRSVREEYRTMELVEDWGQGAFGIGVVRL